MKENLGETTSTQAMTFYKHKQKGVLDLFTSSFSSVGHLRTKANENSHAPITQVPLIITMGMLGGWTEETYMVVLNLLIVGLLPCSLVYC